MALTWSTIKKGSRGEDVKFAQTLLSVICGFTLDRDGIYGDKTFAAVRYFQRESDIFPDDGIVGPDTWSYLSPTLRTTTDPWGYNPYYIEHVVRRLKEDSFYLGAVTDKYTAAVAEGVKNFQRYYKLDVDGIWGKQCWRQWWKTWA